jgi:energy-coupling factor transport system ATP-binding protein
VIVFEGVSFSYREGGQPAVSDLSLSIGEGERVALVGPNGSGKSTVALLSNGILAPQSGRVVVDGCDTTDDAVLDRVRAAVGLVLQNPDNQIVGATVEEDVAFGPENLAVPPEEIRRRVRAAMDAVGLSGLERREPHTLSEGQKQRLAIAGALAMEPRYLVMDEPTAMLDPAGRQSVLAAIARLHSQGRAVVHITHDSSEIAQCDRVVGLCAGRVVYDGDALSFLGDAEAVRMLEVELAPTLEVARFLAAAGVPVPLVPDPARLVAALWA